MAASFPPARAQVPFNNKIAGLGDSITAQGWSTTTLQVYRDLRGFMNWVAHLSGQRVFWDATSSNFGIAGQTSTQIAARVGSVVASGCGTCVVMAGTNDTPSTPMTAAQTIANLQTIYDALYGANIVCIAVPILPRSSGTTQQIKHYLQVNNWIKEQRIARAGRYFYVADPTLAYGDPASATYAALAANVYDGVIHPTHQGAYTIANAIVPIIKSLFPDAYSPTWSPQDIYDAADNPTGNLAPTFFGTTGSKAGTATGTVATSWTGSDTTAGGATVAFSAPTASDGRQQQVVTISGNYTGTFAFVSLSTGITTTSLTAGDVVEALVEYDVAAGSQNYASLSLYFAPTIGGQSYALQEGVMAAGDVFPAGGVTGALLRTPRWTIPSGSITGASLNLRAFLKYSTTSVPVSATVTMRSPVLKKVQ